MFERHSSHALSIIASLVSSDLPCEVQDLYARFTLDTASEFLFGQNLNTLSSSLPVPGQGVIGAKGSVTTDSWGSFAQAFEEIQQIVTNRRRLGYIWPLFELFDDKTTPQVTAIRLYLDPIVTQVLHDMEAMENSGLESPMEEKTFIQHLAESTKGQTALSSPDDLLYTHKSCSRCWFDS
jgi:hypothetical protein